MLTVLTIASAQMPTPSGTNPPEETPETPAPQEPEAPAPMPVPNPTPTPSPNPTPNPIPDIEINIPIPNPTPEPNPNPSPAPNSEPHGGCNNGASSDFRTQTIGGWGSKPNGNNPGKYLHHNFNSTFPQGVLIGSGHTIRFTSADAITEYLPDGGSPKALDGSYTNPEKLRNNLASQILALTLSVGFDRANPDFGKSPALLGNQKITTGTFKGWTVQQLLAEANRVLGGMSSAYSPSVLNDAISKCNEAFVDGRKSTGYLGGSRHFDHSGNDDYNRGDNDDDRPRKGKPKKGKGKKGKKYHADKEEDRKDRSHHSKKGKGKNKGKKWGDD